MSNISPLINKRAIAASFSKAADSYDKAAILQQEIGARLLKRLELIKINPKRILDVGCGTGFLTKQLTNYYPNAAVYGIDIAEGMIQYAKQNHPLPSQNRYLCCDADQLPFGPQTFDFIFSNCSFQWVNNLPNLFSELHHIRSPDGLIIFTTLGPDTLKELRASFAQLDQNTHINTFDDMHNIGDAMLNAKFQDPVMDMEVLTINYDSLRQLMNDLKQTGAHNLNPNRPKHLMTKNYLSKLQEHYENYRSNDNYLPASFEVIYGHAWGANFTQRQVTDELGQTLIPLSNIKTLSHS